MNIDCIGHWYGPPPFSSSSFRTGKLMRGWVHYLPRDNIELYLLVPPQRRDNTTQFLIESADQFRPLPASLEVARKSIADLKLHAIIYPDIGMEVGIDEG